MRRTNRRELVSVWLGVILATVLLLDPEESGAQSPEARLDSPTTESGRLTFHASGIDPAAPRRLVLWRFERGAYRRLASGQSDSSGRFDFGEWPIPLKEGSFHVTPEGISPDGSRPIRISLPLPSPLIISSGVDPNKIEIVPALFEGEIQVRDAKSGRLLLRRVIEERALGRRVIDFEAEGVASLVDFISIEQVLADGRRSRLISWRLERP